MAAAGGETTPENPGSSGADRSLPPAPVADDAAAVARTEDGDAVAAVILEGEGKGGEKILSNNELSTPSQHALNGSFGREVETHLDSANTPGDEEEEDKVLDEDEDDEVVLDEHQEDEVEKDNNLLLDEGAPMVRSI